MLVYFSAENFRSIKDKVSLDLKTAPRLRRMPHHAVTPTKDKSLKVLRSALIYGANASGKSNIIKAISYSKNIITRSFTPSKKLATDPFLLCDEPKKDSSFYFEFVSNGKLYGYGIRLNSQRIEHEYLYIYISNEDEICMLDREYDKDKNEYNIKSEIFEYEDDEEYKEKIKELSSLIKYTPETKTFLSEVKDKKLYSKSKLGKIASPFGVACAFFYQQLLIIFPNTVYLGLASDLDNGNDRDSSYIDHLAKFDTGVHKIVSEKVSLDIFDDEVISEIKERLISEPAFISHIYNGQEYRFQLENNGELVASKIRSLHKLQSGKEVSFSIDNESDGTKRLLDLLPALSGNDPDEGSYTYIIDEFERSLHPNLSKHFLKTFLECVGGHPQDQLIVTTHESSLLDSSLLRRDEIWFAQKERDSSTSLYSLNDYSPRFDKELRKAYLDGIFGAVPIIMNSFAKDKKNKECIDKE
ncbi:ATP-binding protein [Vibrio fluvialis]|nr:ATP-binding protein [Vibrio fluvialis]MBY8208079.1 ATP-binding protein [Vibrio fluvialis]